ncbi:hypothetical protein R84B8_01452 [Treponema sp. R8-4-B8]
MSKAPTASENLFKSTRAWPFSMLSSPIPKDFCPSRDSSFSIISSFFTGSPSRRTDKITAEMVPGETETDCLYKRTASLYLPSRMASLPDHAISLPV